MSKQNTELANAKSEMRRMTMRYTWKERSEMKRRDDA